MRILANDGLDKKAVEVFENENYQVDTDHHTLEELKGIIGDYDVLIVRSATKVFRKLIDAAKGTRLKLVVRAGVGVDNIDVDYAKANGIDVRNTPNSSSNSVAELVLGHMFGLARHIVSANLTMREGEWNKKHYTGIELQGKTLGIIGFGRIGRALAQKASALGMEVVFYDNYIECDERFECLKLDEVLRRADFLTLHVQATEKPMIGENEINIMKDTAIIINTSRGGVVEEDALLEALNSNRLGAAAIDVFTTEPNPNSLLCNHPRVSVTPHIGAATAEAQERIGQEVVDIVLEIGEKLKTKAS
ncbi:MAG TPA: D-2-hydroxyacid dehydrogenase [Tissierellaceae bacterium]|nr:D-2-hydroxyacid dehydrogenase [Tissierellaceae bacterium]